MTTDPPIRVARIVPRTIAEGPGRRFAVWVQGCSIRCEGCFNSHLWSPVGGRLMSADELARQAIAAGVEGVTLLGGEPFEQAAGLARFARLVQDAGLSVMTFTGFTMKRLLAAREADPGTAALLDATDLLVDGPFVRSRLDMDRPWVGSTNQQFRFLTGRYAHLATRWETLADRLEIRVASDGTTSVNGWASTDQLDALLSSDDFRDPFGVPPTGSRAREGSAGT